VAYLILNDRFIQNLILEHARKPRNYGKLENAAIYESSNPGCNDAVLIYYKYVDQKLVFSFEAFGCTLSRACASILLEEINRKSIDEIKEYGKGFLEEILGSKIINSRPKCSTLALNTVMCIVHELNMLKPSIYKEL